jgi:hypothetical protein
LKGKEHTGIKVSKDANGNCYAGEQSMHKIFEATYGYFECKAKMNWEL